MHLPLEATLGVSAVEAKLQDDFGKSASAHVTLALHLREAVQACCFNRGLPRFPQANTDSRFTCESDLA